MQIKTDFTLSFDEDQYIAMHGEQFGRLLRQPSRRAAWEQALAEIQELARPAAAWDRFAVRRILHDKLVLVNGAKIGGGPVVTVIGGAEDLIVAVCTIGPEVDRGILAHQRNKDMFKALLLDELASWAVDQVRQQVCRWLEDEAHGQGLRASTPLSPGESAWPVEEQRILFSLLDAGQVGVRLSESMIMYPLKSLSLILGTGRNPMGVEGASNCDFCSIKERCNYRHLRVGGHA